MRKQVGHSRPGMDLDRERPELTSREFEAAQEITAIAAESLGVEEKAQAWFEILQRLSPMVGISLSAYSAVTGEPRTVAAAHYPLSILKYLDDGYLRDDRAYRGMVADRRRDFNWSTAGFDYACSPSAVHWFRPAGYSGGSTSMLYTRRQRYVANLHISTEAPDLPNRRTLTFIQLIAPALSAAVESERWPRKLVGELGPETSAAFVTATGATWPIDEGTAANLLGSGSELVQQVNRLRDVIGDAITGPRTWLWQTATGEWHTVHCVRLHGELLVLHRPTSPPYQLTRRELEAATLISVGATSREIAAALRISERTVTRHLENIMGKIGVQNRTQLAFRTVTEGFGLLTRLTVPFMIAEMPRTDASHQRR